MTERKNTSVADLDMRDRSGLAPADTLKPSAFHFDNVPVKPISPEQAQATIDSQVVQWRAEIAALEEKIAFALGDASTRKDEGIRPPDFATCPTNQTLNQATALEMLLKICGC